MAAHQYWGLLVTARAGSGNGVSIAEVEMRATAGGLDQCVGGTASGVNTSSQPPANAFDNLDETIWYNGATGGNPTRLSYAFMAAVSVVEISVRNPAATGIGSGFPGATFGPAACWPQWSDDGVTWYYGGPATGLGDLGNAETRVIGGVSDAPPGPYVFRGSKITLDPGWPTQALNAQVRGSIARIDVEDGGPYRIAGTTEREVTPGVFAVYPYRRVRLLERLTSRLVREQWSDPVTGAYEFPQIKFREYIQLTDDHARYYNAVAADLITPVL